MFSDEPGGVVVGGVKKSDKLVSFHLISHMASGGLAVKNPPAQQETWGLIPGLGRSPEEGNGNLLQCSCLENSMNRGAW